MVAGCENGVPNGVVHHLPDSQSPTLALVHPTPEEQHLQTLKNSDPWRGALSLDAYLLREKVLADQEFTRNGGITFWGLVDAAAKDRVMLCGCETFRKKALVACNGKVQEVLCHGVGSVFCPPEYRRRGYAHRMMREVGEKLKTWQGGALFSVLFSDIGKEFYNLNGWEPFNSSHITVPASSEPTVANFPEARPLHAEDLAELCRTDEQLLRRSMQHASPSNSSKIFIAVIPEIATIRWHHAREDFIARQLHGRVPNIKGAIVDGDGPGKRVWCYWTRMWYNEDPAASNGNTLHVLRLVVEEYGALDWERPSTTDESEHMKCKYAPAIAALLRLAQKEAAEWKMEGAEVWNPTVATVEAARMLKPEATVVDRESESIASLRWYGERSQEGGRVADHVDWIANEKYGWC